MSAAPWEDFLREHFPAYLLPESAARSLDVEEAARFLERLTGRPHELALLRAASTLSPRMGELRELALRLLPELVRSLPSQSEAQERHWEGGFQGKLAIAPTLVHWMAGRRTHFVTRSRRRTFDLPENVLVRAVAERLLRLIVDLRQADTIGASGWGADALECEGKLRHLLSSSILRQVPVERVEPHHERAAHAAHHPCYRAALDWHRALHEGLDARDPSRIAAVVAKGALAPLSDSTRFEIAVVIRLIQALWQRLDASEPERWVCERPLVRKNRKEVAELRRDDGARVRIFYNQSHLEAGPCDLGVRHYLNSIGRLRPDATIVVEHDGVTTATVIEVKLSDKLSYLVDGFQEAIVYRWEYAKHLRGWPKAILVASQSVPGLPRAEDDVVAVGWDAWVPEAVIDGVLAPLGVSAGSGPARHDTRSRAYFV
jgi:hypothetical protein